MSIYKFSIFLNIGLFSAGGMGLWHGVEYYETEKLSGSEYFKDWPQVCMCTCTKLYIPIQKTNTFYKDLYLYFLS
jgi:hypothetical protein